MAELTGLEPATSSVTGRRSNQLSYSSTRVEDISKGRHVLLAFTKGPRRVSGGYDVRNNDFPSVRRRDDVGEDGASACQGNPKGGGGQKAARIVTEAEEGCVFHVLYYYNILFIIMQYTLECLIGGTKGGFSSLRSRALRSGYGCPSRRTRGRYCPSPRYFGHG